jgi:hypothetical protein
MPNTIPKPDMNEFFIRNIPLREALDARARWKTLSAAELVELGFIGAATASEERAEHPSMPKRSLMN